jgi:hypothetical protein
VGSFGRKKKKREELCKDNFPKQHETCQIVKLKVKCTGALQIKERNADNVGRRVTKLNCKRWQLKFESSNETVPS